MGSSPVANQVCWGSIIAIPLNLTIPYPRYYELRYEGLVTKPLEEMARVLVFLGEPWEPQVAEVGGQPGDFDHVRQATGKESPTLRRLAEPLTTARVGVWERVVGVERWNGIRRELTRRGEGRLVDELTSASARTV